MSSELLNNNLVNNQCLFKFKDYEIRAFVVEDILWICGKDVANAMSYKNAYNSINDHVDEIDKKSLDNLILENSAILLPTIICDKAMKTVESITTDPVKITLTEINHERLENQLTLKPSVTLINSEQDKILSIENIKISEDNNQERLKILSWDKRLIFINESGLYSLIMASKLPRAKEFKHWVTSEVLPSIGKNKKNMPNEKFQTSPEIVQKSIIELQKQIDENNSLKGIIEIKTKSEENSKTSIEELINKLENEKQRTTQEKIEKEKVIEELERQKINRTRRQMETGDCFYITSTISQPDYCKIGQSKNINGRIDQYLTRNPDEQLRYLIYLEECVKIETYTLSAYKVKKLRHGHEVIVMDFNLVIEKVKNLLNIFDLPYRELEDLSLFQNKETSYTEEEKKMYENEEWRILPENDGYEMSSYKRFRNNKTKQIKGADNKTSIRLSKDNFRTLYRIVDLFKSTFPEIYQKEMSEVEENKPTTNIVMAAAKRLLDSKELNGEIWKILKENKSYEISNFKRIRNLRTKKIKSFEKAGTYRLYKTNERQHGINIETLYKSNFSH